MGKKNRNKKGGHAPGKGPKLSLTKLSNKRLNKLAKQGKLKKRMPKKELLNFVKGRTTGEQQLEVTDPLEKKEAPEKEDIPLVEADYDYFATKERNFNFLMNVNEEQSSKKQRKRKRAEGDDEASYEKTPRSLGAEGAETRALLPIKGEKGVIARSEAIEDEDDEAEEEEDQEDDADAAPAEPLPALSTAELMARRQEKLSAIKARMALIASSIIEMPDDNVSKLKELRLLLEEDDPDIYVTTKKLGMISLAEVFKDIIPDYRIRELSDTEKQQAAKKETKHLRDFEASLINNYRHYLEFLEAIAKGKKPKTRNKEKRKRPQGVFIPAEAAGKLSFVAVRCLCELLVTHPHFNYRTNIIAVITPFAAHNNAEVSDMVCDYIKKLFREDKEGQVTLEVVRLIGRIIKNRKFNVHPKVLKLFLSLKIREVERPEDKEKEKAAGKKDGKKEDKRTMMSKREKKRKKQMKQLEQELEEAAVTTDTKKRLRIHTEIINMIFLTYFRILKQATHSILLSPVLEGLAKFAHLINIDFFDDLFSVLNELVDSGDLSYRESLHCVQTAFTLLTGAGLALNIDPIRFYTHLYNVLLTLHGGASSEDVPIALRCLDILINKRRKQVSHARILAFIKRLGTVALQMSSSGAMGIMAMIRSFLHADPGSDILFDSEHQGSGLFLPELSQPEHCNAHNTALYELCLLQRHFHPTVRRYGEHLLLGAPSTGHGQLSTELARRSAEELFNDYDPNEMTFNPPVNPTPKSKSKKMPQSNEIAEEALRLQLAEHEDSQTSELPDMDFFADFSKPNNNSDSGSKPRKEELSDEDFEDEEVDETGFTETEKVLLSLKVEEKQEVQKEEEDEVEDQKGGFDGDRHQNKRGPGFKKPGFRNKHFKNFKKGGGGRRRGSRGRGK